MDHTVLPANTLCLPFLRKRSPDGATSNWGKRHLIAAYYSSIDPEGMKGWAGLVGWPNSGRFTHISGHPSAKGRAQDRESSPAEDRRSTTQPRNQPKGRESGVCDTTILHFNPLVVMVIINSCRNKLREAVWQLVSWSLTSLFSTNIGHIREKQ